MRRIFICLLLINFIGCDKILIENFWHIENNSCNKSGKIFYNSYASKCTGCITINGIVASKDKFSTIFCPFANRL